MAVSRIACYDDISQSDVAVCKTHMPTSHAVSLIDSRQRNYIAVLISHLLRHFLTSQRVCVM